MIMRQTKLTPKIRWSGFLTQDNFDWLCKIAHAEDRSLANLLNRIISAARSTWNSNAQNSTK